MLGGIGEIGISIKPSVQHRPDILLHMIHHPAGAMISAPAAAWLDAFSPSRGNCYVIAYAYSSCLAEPIFFIFESR